MKEQDYEQLTLFREVSHASLSVFPGTDEARRTTVSSGLKCSELYRKSGPVGSLVKMLLGSSVWSSTVCYLTWKPKTTPSKRLLFQLVPSTPRIDGIGASLLGTPTAEMRVRSPKFRAGRAPNPAEVALWPTPTARDCKGANSLQHLTRQGHKKNHTGQLANAVRLYPTPKAQNCRGNGERHGEGGPSLDVVVGGQLSPMWVEWLMGFPIGWTELEGSETP